jgi:hypothetical protein
MGCEMAPTKRSSANTVVRCDLPIRFNSSSRKSTSIKMFEMAFSFIMGMSRPVKKSYQEIFVNKTWTNTGRKEIYHQALGNISKSTFICFLLIRLLDHQRVNDSGQPIDQLVQVHARWRLPWIWCPVVFWQFEALVEFRVYQARHTSTRAGDGCFKRRGSWKSDDPTSLRWTINARGLRGRAALG